MDSLTHSERVLIGEGSEWSDHISGRDLGQRTWAGILSCCKFVQFITAIGQKKKGARDVCEFTIISGGLTRLSYVGLFCSNWLEIASVFIEEMDVTTVMPIFEPWTVPSPNLRSMLGLWGWVILLLSCSSFDIVYFKWSRTKQRCSSLKTRRLSSKHMALSLSWSLNDWIEASAVVFLYMTLTISGKDEKHGMQFSLNCYHEGDVNSRNN